MNRAQRCNRRVLLASLLYSFVVKAEDVTNLGKPISVPPSQYWDGKDGPWSTFRIELGNPPQQIRVLPASSQSTTWVVLPEACAAADGKDCTANRGRSYMRNESSTWDEYGTYELDTFLEERVGLDGDGLYGYENLSLGWTGDSLTSLERQLIAGIITKDFYLGSLSLNPRPHNFTNFNNPIPSLLHNLRNASTPIPSTSWSYTAGSNNLSPKVFGSLVLGGYDASRFQPNDVSFPFGADISLDFQVAIQSITSNITEQPLLTTGIISYIDTLVAEIWLPVRTCAKFEEAFGLVWDDTTELYLLNDTLHESLLEKNPTISFQLGPEVSGASVTIEMPYFNFYQTATSAYLGNSSGLYFPLKRAVNDTQYVLGRTFLQSAYISADYDRSLFNLSQALYPSSSTAPKVVAILPPISESSPPGGGSIDSSGSNKPMGVGVIAGIAVGGLVALVALTTALVVLRRRKRKKTNTDEAHELEDTNRQTVQPHEAAGEDIKYEVGEGLRHEVTGDYHPKPELEGGVDFQKPVESGGKEREIYEMPADEAIKAVEMDAESHPKSVSVGYPATESAEVISFVEDDQSPLTSPYRRAGPG